MKINKKYDENELKLIKWHFDRYPPIDLNSQMPHVIDLIKEVIRLRNIIEGLTKCLPQ